MPFVHEIADALYLGILYLQLMELISGEASKLRIFSHSLTRITGTNMTTLDGLQFNQQQGDLSTQYRMDYYLTPAYIHSSMNMPSRLIRMITIRLLPSGLQEKILKASILIGSYLLALVHLLISFYDGTSDRLS